MSPEKNKAQYLCSDIIDFLNFISDKTDAQIVYELAKVVNQNLPESEQENNKH